MEQIYIPKQDYKVLVRCFTYNQSKYIEDALNGFAMQQTEFPFVCLVMDDCSTDGEQEVIKAWMERECDMVKAEYIDLELSNVIIVPHKTNMNCTFAIYLLKMNLWKEPDLKGTLVIPWLDHCEYEAICEGDDYWIAEDKLQIQVNYLDKYLDYSMVFGKYNIYYQERGKFESPRSKDYTGLLSLFNNNMIATASVLYRIELYKEYADEIGIRKDWKMGDYPLWLFAAIKSNIGFIPNIFSVYRVLSKSASHSKEFEPIRDFIINVQEIKEFFINKYNLQHLINKDELVDNTNRSLFVHAYSMGYVEECKKYGKMIKNRTFVENVKLLLCNHPYLYSIHKKIRFSIY